ncbi:hypothetical protein OSB04_004540 [Centaurea solstitialis]|uniref:FH2 domain-containing protein n=1 Tax=Centaurea solstitialis TaxID=347529 RepID=A0AA38TX72_9ASTR|nr:hypothetical protein OSB04_004540 [Centaurea solstitialis]
MLYILFNSSVPEFNVSELETLFSAIVAKKTTSKDADKKKATSEKIQLIDLRRANNTEIMLTKVNMPLPEMVPAILAMDDTRLDSDQVENILKFCPTKQEMDQLKYFLELMKVPRIEAKLNVFLFKIQFNAQLAEIKKSLNMVLASKSPTLLDFHEDLVSLEAASKIQMKQLAEEMQSIIKGLEKVQQELAASANDGPVSEVFHKVDIHDEYSSPVADPGFLDSDGTFKTLKEFIGVAEAEVTSVTNLYAIAGRNADALALYFGEDPARCPFEQVTQTLLHFVRDFQKSHEENLKQEVELEKKKVARRRERKAKENENTESCAQHRSKVYASAPLLLVLEEIEDRDGWEGLGWVSSKKLV